MKVPTPFTHLSKQELLTALQGSVTLRLQVTLSNLWSMSIVWMSFSAVNLLVLRRGGTEMGMELGSCHLEQSLEGSRRSSWACRALRESICVLILGSIRLEPLWIQAHLRWISYRANVHHSLCFRVRNFPHQWLNVTIIQKDVSEEWLEQFLEKRYELIPTRRVSCSSCKRNVGLVSEE